VQLLVEGGATVAGEFHRRGLVDRYVLYLAPALFGGDDARGLFSGPGARTIGDVWRGRIVDVKKLGADLRIDVEAR
jgi:diaminohydroxyphosphoribosylaminopyrimidine deaminase/5-amino-6-(5-phosphoribosylamino)uracil reductase